MQELEIKKYYVTLRHPNQGVSSVSSVSIFKAFVHSYSDLMHTGRISKRSEIIFQCPVP